MKFLIIFVLLFLNSILIAEDNNLKKVSLQLNWKHQFEFAGFYIAKEKGFYKDIGLDLEIKEYNNDIDVTNFVSTGKATFGINYPTVVLEKSKGEPIVLLSAILQSSPHALISLESSNINILEDLKNKSLMINKEASKAAPFISMFQSKKLSFDDLKIIPHSFKLDDLINKKVDVSTIFRTNEPFILDQKGIKYKIWDPKDYGFDFYDDLLFTSSDIAKNEKAMVQSFKKASLEGFKYAFLNKDETAELILEKYNSQNKSKEALIYEAKELEKLAFYKTNELGKVDKSNVQRIYDIYNVLGLTEEKINLDEFIFSSKEQFLTAKEKSYLLENSFNVYINNWKPFALLDKESLNFQGLAIDFWEKVVDTTSINHSIKSSNTFIDLLNSTKKDAHAIALSLSKTEDREEYAAFTKPYVSYSVAIATNVKEKYILDLNQLEGKKVAVGKNFSAHKLLKENYPKIDFVPVKNTIEALELLANKKVYAAADILPTLSYYLNELAHSNLKISGTSEQKLQLRMMVNKENSDLIPILNKAINNISNEDKKLIHNKWTIHNRNIEKIDYTLLFMILVPIVLIMLFVLILNNSQRKYIRMLKRKENHIKDQAKKLKERETVLSKYVLYSRTDKKGVIVDVSDAFCRTSGYSREELIGNTHSLIRHPDMNIKVYKDLWQTLKKGKDWTGEIKNKRKDGKYYWVDANMSPEVNDEGEIIGFVSIRVDITAKKDFEKQHITLLEKSKMASLGEMLANIAHQWRQPLNAISTAASGLQLYQETDNLNKKTLNEFSDLIINQSQYLSETIETFKNFIKNEKTEKEVIIQDEISEALNIVQTTLKHNFIEIDNKIDYENPIVLTLRGGELTQVLINILNNSKDVLLERSIENPRIQLNLGQEEELTIITIEDNAGGIADEILPHIFEPYYTTKHKSQGTGLGLYMSYRIVSESLNGVLSVKNGIKGAVFYIKIPSE